MDKLHAVLAWLHVAMLYPIMGVPVWILSVVFTFPIVDQLVKRAGWTTARGFVELAARFLLKSPLLGPSLALVPLLGDILHKVANDLTVPPTLAMRIKDALPEKKDPSDKPPGASGTISTGTAATVTSVTVTSVTVVIGFALSFIGLAFVPSCNTLSGKAAVSAGKVCETKLAPAEEQLALTQVTSILADPISWEADLLVLGTQIGIGQVNCLVQMAVAGVQALIHPPTDGGVLHAASVRATYAPNIVVVNGNAWLAKHGGAK